MVPYSNESITSSGGPTADLTDAWVSYVRYLRAPRSAPLLPHSWGSTRCSGENLVVPETASFSQKTLPLTTTTFSLNENSGEMVTIKERKSINIYIYAYARE